LSANAISREFDTSESYGLCCDLQCTRNIVGNPEIEISPKNLQELMANVSGDYGKQRR
jgi:hypothetical protein